MTDLTPAKPRAAASMLFARDGAQGVEVYMVVRNHVVDFAANAAVFPGGKLTPDDEVLASTLKTGGHLAPPYRGLAVAALRESFEEAGLLLASQADGTPLPESRVRGFDAVRPEIDQGTRPFSEFLKAERLELDLGSLHRFANIITPKEAPKRFDAHFFIAPAPAAHDPRIDMHEVVAGFWASAASLMTHGADNHVLMRPTRIVLGRLAQFRTVDLALADAASFEPPAIEPTFEMRDGKSGLATPDLPGFAASWEQMDDKWRLSVGGTKTPE